MQAMPKLSFLHRNSTAADFNLQIGKFMRLREELLNAFLSSAEYKKIKYLYIVKSLISVAFFVLLARGHNIFIHDKQKTGLIQ